MSDRGLVAVGVIAFISALTPIGWPSWLVLMGIVTAIRFPNVAFVSLAVALLCSMLATRSWSGIDGERLGAIDGRATVISDPRPRGSGTSAVVRLDGHRYIAVAFGPDAATLRVRHAGEEIQLSGTISPYNGSRERRAALHTGHRIGVSSLQFVGAGLPHSRVANALRTRIEGGATSLGEAKRSLFTGLVYGDDRSQSEVIAADFSIAGLTHLLAVSGQNVAYVLTLARPMIQRVPRRGRVAAVGAILFVFATATRFEPSVSRATVMAGLAALATHTGREGSGLRLLALAVAGLLVVDPLLAETISFRLSVAASFGILAFSRRIEPRLRGPQWIREATAVTIAAQLAVAPILVPTFGPVSVMSIPANVLAGPAAGAVMVWGMTAGIVAGFVPTGLAAAIHMPTRAMLWWLELVARLAGAMPVRPIGLVGIGALVALWLAARPLLRAGDRAGRTAVALLAGTVAVLTMWPTPTPASIHVGRASTLWTGRALTVLALDDGDRIGDLLESFHDEGIRQIDVLVAARNGPGLDATVAALRDRIAIGIVWHPEGRARTRNVDVGSFTITVREVEGVLETSIMPARPAESSVVTAPG